MPMPRPPFDLCEVVETNVPGSHPYSVTFTYSEQAGTTPELWAFDLPADLGSALVAYVAAQRAAGQPFDRAQILTYLTA